MRRALLHLMLFVALATPAFAQYPAEVAAGTRVRLVVRDSVRQSPLWSRQQMVMGTVAGIGGDTLYVALPFTSGTLGVPRTSLRQLSISRGVPSRFESAMRHGVAAAVAGALTLYLDHEWGDDTSFDSGGEAALIGAGIGFGVGAILGAVSPSERWRRIRLR